MKRRSFFKTTALGGSVVALSGVTACVQESNMPEEVDLASFDLNETYAMELQQKLESGELTAKSI